MSRALTNQSLPFFLEMSGGKIFTNANSKSSVTQLRSENAKDSVLQTHTALILKIKADKNDERLSLNSASSSKQVSQTKSGNVEETSQTNESSETPAEVKSSGSIHCQPFSEALEASSRSVKVVVRSPKPQNSDDITSKGKAASKPQAKTCTSTESATSSKSNAARIRKMQALAKLRVAVFERTIRSPNSWHARISRRQDVCSTNNPNSTLGSHSDRGVDAPGRGHLHAFMAMKRHRRPQVGMI